MSFGEILIIIFATEVAIAILLGGRKSLPVGVFSSDGSRWPPKKTGHPVSDERKHVGSDGP